MSVKEPRPRYVPAACSLAAPLLLAGCLVPGQSETDDLKGATAYSVSSGFIGEVENQAEYPYVREQPEKMTDGAGMSTNDCSRVESTIPFGPTTVWLNEGSPNGAYVGFELDELPDYIQEACSADADGMVWVVESSVIQNITGPGPSADTPS